jgi:phosphate-selective porin OprO and OprP
MRSFRQFGPFAAAGAATVLLLAPEPGAAQSNAELMNIIRQQQRQIEELSRKVDALQSQVQQATEEADAAAVTARQTEQDAPDMSVEWGPGPTLSSQDGSWSVHVLGRLLVDGGVLDDDDDLYDGDNATEVRAARLGIEGEFLEGFEFKLETDFADSDVDLKDAFIEYGGTLVEPAYVRVGQFKTPNSLEQLTSRRFLPLMERPAIIDAFELDYQLGLGNGVGGDNWGVDAGLFGQNASEQENDEGYALAARGHYALLFGPEDRPDAVHLGASARYRNLDNDTFDNQARYRQRPFFHFTGTHSVDTGVLDDSEGDVWAGAEFAWTRGPFTLQGEVANTALQRNNGEDDANNLWGAYLGASYFLTGERRTYDAERGVFDRVEVERPLQDGGPGAWELAARADYIDLNSDGVKGGEQISYIGGVNWYLNDYVRFMLDGAITQVFNARDSAAAVDGSSNLIYGAGMLAQVDW